MPTHWIDMTSATADRTQHDARVHAAAQKVVIVNGGNEVLELLESVLDAGHYDVVFVEATAHAYSQIKKIQPDLVILSLDLNDGEGFRVLSMLKLDVDTRNIPVLTSTKEREDEGEDEPEPSEDEMFAARPMLRMN
jgi:PleD family two-component response regulator